MINREQFINEIAEVVNRNSMEKAFNDTSDFILARIAVEAMEGKEGDAMKNKCSSEIPNMPTECAPDNRRPEKICGTCRYFNPEFPVNGKPAPVCLAIKEMKGGTEYSNPRGTQHYFRCSNGRYENGIGQ
jgi:hypothetical protein